MDCGDLLTVKLIKIENNKEDFGLKNGETSYYSSTVVKLWDYWYDLNISLLQQKGFLWFNCIKLNFPFLELPHALSAETMSQA